MKLKHIIPAALFTLVVLAGCKKIELKPIGQVPPELAVKNEADVMAILNATYTPLRGDNFWGGRSQLISELMSDFVDGVNFVTGEYPSIFNLGTTATNGTVANIYREPYYIIQRANVTLQNLALIGTDANRKNAEGQAKFMRGFSEFELVKMFAQPYGYTPDNSHPGIVIQTSGEFERLRKRNTVKETYEQIIADLKAAETLLPATNGNYPSSWAAKAMLARVYFQMNDFANAYAYANMVIASNQFPFDNTANFVTNRFGATKTPEAIWWLVNEVGQNPSFGTLRNNVNPEQSMGLPITRSAYLAGSSNASDRRSAWYKDSLTASGEHVYSIRKYRAPVFVLPVLHITEMKLIRAESAAELNQNLAVAIADINDITNRAYGGTLAPLPANATAAAIIARVRAERKLEMVFESGDRLQQLKRIGAKGEASVVGQANWNCPGFVLQIPASEAITNIDFEQNPQGGCSR
ncbi:MAG TPA: RagB/SusD family nutrient uptake outer membrane protein [Candidatus Saccharimonadales bacterium]|nr:RagB/SusD family nutrient uptake outer membrane protein [Candidatus Saccharimonadales bacterium]